MEIQSVRCNHCGAPLEVGMETRFVTCQFCNSQLEVKRTESTVFTEEIAKISQNTERMAGSLEVLELQNDLERLDREWIASNPLSFDNDGRPIRQTGTGGAVFGMVFAILFAVVCFGIAAAISTSGAPAIVPLVPIGIGIFALVAAITGIGKATQYESRRSDYEQRRAAMVARLDSMRRS
jgi:DNA-directed RNA polymerase subunit RPC12/RpoP